jgi:hypothetical protein
MEVVCRGRRFGVPRPLARAPSSPSCPVVARVIVCCGGVRPAVVCGPVAPRVACRCRPLPAPAAPADNLEPLIIDFGAPDFVADLSGTAGVGATRRRRRGGCPRPSCAPCCSCGALAPAGSRGRPRCHARPWDPISGRALIVLPQAAQPRRCGPLAQQRSQAPSPDGSLRQAPAAATCAPRPPPAWRTRAAAPKAGGPAPKVGLEPAPLAGPVAFLRPPLPHGCRPCT